VEAAENWFIAPGRGFKRERGRGRVWENFGRGIAGALMNTGHDDALSVGA